eukprot:s1142_g11.t1
MQEAQCRQIHHGGPILWSREVQSTADYHTEPWNILELMDDTMQDGPVDPVPSSLVGSFVSCGLWQTLN